MRGSEPIKDILRETRTHWDHPGTRPSVRTNFEKVIQCGTEALGAEVYASGTECKVVPYTCKSRACPSCGHRATIQWQREQWASLPDVAYAGIVFTMPDVLWPLFREDRRLLDDLPVLGADVVKKWVQEKYGAEVMIMVVRHTFGRHLNFNPHLHVLVSAGGLRSSVAAWIAVTYDHKELMRLWRYAVIAYLRASHKNGRLRSSFGTYKDVEDMLTTQYMRWWSVHVDRCITKEHFIRYAARYVRRPPVAQYRFLSNNTDSIQFRTRDHKLGREVVTTFEPAKFVEALGHHVHDHYQHAIRYFGLLAPRAKGLTSLAVFLLLGQKRRAKPMRLTWAYSLKRAFGVDPLLDAEGKRMVWIARRKPLVGVLT